MNNTPIEIIILNKTAKIMGYFLLAGLLIKLSDNNNATYLEMGLAIILAHIILPKA